ncbi:serine/threonine-protein kinase [Wenzhouxiangella marina]|uniref:Protein kinase domain-containing protein n=1 Tax=Wenzhouxiangella marina TaxID=1579979 RepID=A0A0K0XVP9_9GAMM|nr:serine/threonine-protein kinase [Wenzhouxiangella marina]AKS41784.1 hypothetical protein WM2015_1412 [Wenzhouxiangella marina]MBB6086454.1 serine/threonine protein kinase [Wenzhouxiangella marina]
MSKDKPDQPAATEVLKPESSPDRATEFMATEPLGRDPAATEAMAPENAPTRPDPAAGTDVPGEEDQLKVGSVLRDRFRILGVLGRGGMGTVYKATDLLKEEAHDRDTTIALKVLKPGIVDADITFMALQREARRAQQLAHPNIVTVFDFDRADGVIFMTMEFMRGQGLERRLEEGPIPIPELRRITRELCQGLAYAHERGIVHSDLKPENVFLLEDGRVKILDFGIARAWQSERRDFVEEAVAGCTPAYASPEVLQRKPPSPADDVYALGCVVAQMASGKHPYDWHSGLEALKQKLQPSRPGGLKGREWRTLRSAMALKAADRPKDARAFFKRFFPSPTRVTAWIITALTLVSVGVYLAFFQPEPGPEIPFEALPADLQASIRRNLDDAALFLAQGDLNTALQLYDMALEAHPGNREATSGIEQAVEQALAQLDRAVSEGRLSPEGRRTTLRSLLEYETLPAELRDRLQDALSD